MNDLTVIYITANEIPEKFAAFTRDCLMRAITDTPLISVTKKPMAFGKNVYFETPRSHTNIYREALEGVKLAQTKYIAIAEDDVLYPVQHFEKRPTRDDVFAYNIACWSLYTWSKPPIYSYTGRRNHGMLICNRELYIEAFTERFVKYPVDAVINHAIWAEPGKYESQLGVKVRDTEVFYTDPACIMFTHPQGLSMNTLGYRKRLAPIRAFDIPHWGTAEAIVRIYE